MTGRYITAERDEHGCWTGLDIFRTRADAEQAIAGNPDAAIIDLWRMN